MPSRLWQGLDKQLKRPSKKQLFSLNDYAESNRNNPRRASHIVRPAVTDASLRASNARSIDRPGVAAVLCAELCFCVRAVIPLFVF